MIYAIIGGGICLIGFLAMSYMVLKGEYELDKA